MDNFFDDVWRGLNTSPKYLDSKYFYDDAGDAIFREIMQCPEYYLTNCELEIFSKHSNELAATILNYFHDFDIADLGAGDAVKSAYLLEALLKQNAAFTYYPIDISSGVISLLNEKLQAQLPGLKMHGLNGGHFAMLEELKRISSKNKVVLFLGSSIGNIPLADTVSFFSKAGSYLLPGGLVLTGFDLKKDPAIILAAYNDKAGITSRFNLNLLQRINDTLGADFDLSQFAHKPVYNDGAGVCESYLESLKNQEVRIGNAGSVYFKAGEKIFMESSQKYTVQQTDDIAIAAGFKPIQHYFDSRNWFLSALWQWK